MGAEKLDPQTNPLLDKRFVNAFIEATVKTMTLMAQTEVTVGTPSVHQVFQSTGEVAGTVSLKFGSSQGAVSISFEKEAIFKILENMLGEQHTEVTDAVADAVGELTNQIYGSAKTTLNQMGFDFEMAIPSTIKGSLRIHKEQAVASLKVPFILAESHFYIDITVA